MLVKLKMAVLGFFHKGFVGGALRSENSRILKAVAVSEIPCWKGFLANFDAAGK